MSHNGINPKYGESLTKKKYDYLVFIGRFQPFHNGHKAVIQRALEISENVIVLVGSVDQPRSTRNPFTFDERRNVIAQEFSNDYGQVSILALPDSAYNDEGWVSNVQSAVTRTILPEFKGNSAGITLHGMNDFKIGLIGCNKDHSSYYLKLFPQWGSESVEFINPINATDIRNEYFDIGVQWDWDRDDQLPSSSLSFLERFKETRDWENLKDEHEFIQDYKEQWEAAPYPPTFVTTDAVVVQSGHILLIRRGATPGKGLWALPGGFLNQNELIIDGMVRELREETGLKVPDAVIKGSIQEQKVFDNPNRSERGRTITHAFLVKLEDRTELPKVKGGDDADKAKWIPLSVVSSMNMFEDHYHIIMNFVGI